MVPGFRIMKANHCDGPGCDTWRREPNGELWLEIHDSNLHFCCWDCLSKYAAGKTATAAPNDWRERRPPLPGRDPDTWRER